MSLMDDLKVVDPEIAKVIDAELNRQRNKLELIASENIVSAAVSRQAVLWRLRTRGCGRAAGY